MRRLWLAWLALALGGCGIEDYPFRCDADAACVKSGVQGTCELSGYCAFPDEDCDSKRRYGSLAPSELADHCVPRCVEQLSLGQYHSCARLADGSLRCWGDAREGQLGNGVSATESYPSPVAVATEVLPALDVSAGKDHTCSVRAPEGSVWCWGSNAGAQLGAGGAGPGPLEVDYKLAKAVPALEVAAGIAHSCSRSAAGVWCWGANQFGQLGRTTVSPFAGPIVAELGGKDILSVAVGAFHTCAVPSIGPLLCWGNNEVGQVTGKPSPGVTPPTTLPLPATQVSLGAGHTCALSNGKVACIGDDKQLQLGGTEPGTPIPLERDAVAISAGYAHTCALLDDGRLACWGSNQYGQLGPNADPGPPSLPVLVDLGVPIVKVACGREHTCAKTELDRVYCWGRNDFGQLGNGELGDTTAHAAPDARVTRSLCSPL